jgi:hypothetical protein
MTGLALPQASIEYEEFGSSVAGRVVQQRKPDRGPRRENLCLP